MCAIRDSFLLVWRQNRASLLFHAPDSRARMRSGLAAGGRRPAELRLVPTETCFCQLVAGYLACGRVADDASNGHNLLGSDGVLLRPFLGCACCAHPPQVLLYPLVQPFQTLQHVKLKK